MDKPIESEVEITEVEEVEEIIEEPIKISKKTGKPVKKLSIKQLENLKIGRERGFVIKKCIAENKDISKTTAYIKEVRDIKNKKIEENNKILKEELDEIIEEEIKEPIRKSIKIKKKKKKYIQVEVTDSDSESDGIVIKKEEIIVPPPIIEDSFSIERLLKQKLYNDRVNAITAYMLNKNK